MHQAKTDEEHDRQQAKNELEKALQVIKEVEAAGRELVLERDRYSLREQQQRDEAKRLAQEEKKQDALERQRAKEEQKRAEIASRREQQENNKRQKEEASRRQVELVQKEKEAQILRHENEKRARAEEKRLRGEAESRKQAEERRAEEEQKKAAVEATSPDTVCPPEGEASTMPPMMGGDNKIFHQVTPVHQGSVKLVMSATSEHAAVRELERCLGQWPDVRLVLTGGEEDDIKMILYVQGTVNLVERLSSLPVVQDVRSSGDLIELQLNSRSIQ
jgi:hypothetical protein